MKKLMQYIVPCFFLLLTMVLKGQEGTYYYGSNSRPVGKLEEAAKYKEVLKKSDRKFVVKTFEMQQESWNQVLKEKVKIQGDNSQVILFRSESFFPKKYTREFEEIVPGKYLFREYNLERLLRSGTTAQNLPLHLEGEVTEFHSNQEVKSISYFRNNQLVSNQNWLRDGTHYIDSIFYSVDQEPEYQMGDDFFNSYLLKKLEESGLDLKQIEDQVVIGWVVLESGLLDGAIALKGKSRTLNEFLVKTIVEMPGKWQPARLDGVAVRYFMSIPLNFIQSEANFQDLDFSGGTMHYNRY